MEWQETFVAYGLAALLFLSRVPAPAQNSEPQQAAAGGGTAAEQPAPPQKVLLKEGTRVPLQLAQSLSSKSAVIGQSVELVVREDVKVGDAVVVKRGSRVLGTVVAGKESEKRGVAKEVRMRLDLLKAGDARVKLRGEQTASGKHSKGQIAAATIAFGLSGYLMASSPKNVVIPEGTPVDAFVDEDIELPILR